MQTKTASAFASCLLILVAGSLSNQAQLIWTVGLDDDSWAGGDGGGAAATFVQETGVNPLPGNPANPELDGQADDDYYFAGVYDTVISSVAAAYGDYTPLGVVAANEEAAERAFAGSDNDLRYHFNLPSSLKPNDMLTVTFDAYTLDGNGLDPRYGAEVYFNGVMVQNERVIGPGELDVPLSTPEFSLASVNAAVGPGYDNIVSLKGINYNQEGGGNWMGIDHVELSARIVLDEDHDGVLDQDDACPQSDVRPTVVIDDCETGVANILLDAGCTLSDELNKCGAAEPNHGLYVSCVVRLTSSLSKTGVISDADRKALDRCAAQSRIGR